MDFQEINSNGRVYSKTYLNYIRVYPFLQVLFSAARKEVDPMYIFRASKTLKDGTKIYAKDYGKKSV